MEKQNGVTLVTLAITIIVLLILAGITISLVLGERGIFNTAKNAGQNYKEASDGELADLTNLEKEMQNAINGTENGGSTKPETPAVKLNTVTANNYGDYVDYKLADGSSIGRGPEEIAETHKTDWRIFYNDGTYVYLIASYLLLNSQMPTGTNMTGYEGRPYATFWKNSSSLPAYKEISNVARNQYKMSWNKSTTNKNIKAVSELLDTSKWTKFVNESYAEDAIGAPTLEMWVASLNSTGETLLYCNNSNEYGYYVGTSSSPTTTKIDVSNSNSLYFPVAKGSESEVHGYKYWLSSPSAGGYMLFAGRDCVLTGFWDNAEVSVRPIVRLKSTVTGTLKDGIWTLK